MTSTLSHPLIGIEYISFSDFTTAMNYQDEDVLSSHNCQKLLISLAVKIGTTRLIDNTIVSLV
jgi:pantothenate synthetase